MPGMIVTANNGPPSSPDIVFAGSEEDITASFTDPGFLAAVREIIGKPEGPVLDSDVAGIKELNVGFWDTKHTIYSLSGIEHFKSLTDLTCSYQQLGKLDLSKNAALEFLDCDSTWLTELDVTNNPDLKWLYCGFNQLKALDISHNIHLEDLGIWDNQLTELDLSNNPELTYLDCDGNCLISLDLSQYQDDFWFYGAGQQPSLSLVWAEANGYYEKVVELNNPVFDNGALRYEGGILKSPSRSFIKNSFEIKTGRSGCTLSGDLILDYKRDGGESIKIGETSFPDPAFREWLQDQWFGQEGLIFLDEIKDITKINVDFAGISDLTGLEYFTSLTELRCWGNYLTFMPKLPAGLTGLDCDDNLLIELDLSHCPNNFSFYSGFGQNPTLTLIWDEINGCYSTAIKLNSPTFGDSALTYEDGILKSPNRHLNNISFQVQTGKSGCILSGYLNLVYVDDSEYLEINETNFPDPNFREWLREQWFGEGGIIYIDDIEEITEINVNFTGIADLTGIGYFTSLEELHCMRNGLTSLPALPVSLTGLVCDGNRLIALDLSNCESLLWFSGSEQQPPVINLEWDEINNCFSTVIVLNNPSFGNEAISYEDGILKSPNRGLNNIDFRVATGRSGFTLSGTISFKYPEITGFSVSGKIRSYDPKHSATIQLIQGTVVVREEPVDFEEGYGVREQSFTINGVEPGTYDLVITKEAHTRFTVRNVVVGEEDLDLTKDSRPEVQLIALRCGDISSDGLINDADLTILWRAGNYNKRVGDAENPLCDLNGDGLINDSDLTILWLVYNYNRGPIVI
jgi:Leucine-rich repeat (LRR) protein